VSTNDITTGAGLLRLEDAVKSTFDSLRTLGLAADAAREAVLAQVADTIMTLAYDEDGVPLPTDTDDGGGGGVKAAVR
jgi:hypothetical protein